MIVSSLSYSSPSLYTVPRLPAWFLSLSMPCCACLNLRTSKVLGGVDAPLSNAQKSPGELYIKDDVSTRKERCTDIICKYPDQHEPTSRVVPRRISKYICPNIHTWIICFILGYKTVLVGGKASPDMWKCSHCCHLVIFIDTGLCCLCFSCAELYSA